MVNLHQLKLCKYCRAHISLNQRERRMSKGRIVSISGFSCRRRIAMFNDSKVLSVIMNKRA